MENKSIELSHEQSLIMRGIAIIMIALHNYCHLLEFSVKENESFFQADNMTAFFDQQTMFSVYWVYNFFSFLGWYGITVFIFLTGYGLVKKYENPQSPPMSKSSFLYNNWFKLFALLLPGILYYVAYDIVNYFVSGDIGYIINLYSRLFILTFLNDIFGLWIETAPGAYWYFGLTLEFYLLYAFCVYRRNHRILLLLTLISILLQITVYNGLFGNPKPLLEWVRQNITGWMLPFTFGILLAKVKSLSSTTFHVVTAIAAIIFFPTMTGPTLWQISLLCAVILAIWISCISLKIPYWKGFWIFVGRLSPFIFAAHPMVRGIFFSFSSPTAKPNGLLLIAYISCVFFCAFLYRAIWSLITPRMKNAIDGILCNLNNYLKSK